MARRDRITTAHFCPNCGKPVPEASRFCTECGLALPEAPGAEPAAGASAAATPPPPAPATTSATPAAPVSTAPSAPPPRTPAAPPVKYSDAPVAGPTEYLPTSTITLRREITFSDDLVLSKESEEALLLRDMQNDLVQQLMRRLAAAKLQAVKTE